jgi:hypothetical protein
MGQDPSEIREEIDETRARMGETVEALGYKTDVTTRAKEKVSGTVGGAKAKIGGAGSRVNEAPPGRDEVKQSARKAAGVAQQNPIGLALGSVALGFLVGMLAPSTRVEDEKLGEVSDQVKEKGKETAQEAGGRGKQVAQEAAERASRPPKRAASSTPRASRRPHSRRPKRSSHKMGYRAQESTSCVASRSVLAAHR